MIGYLQSAYQSELKPHTHTLTHHILFGFNKGKMHRSQLIWVCNAELQHEAYQLLAPASKDEVPMRLAQAWIEFGIQHHTVEAVQQRFQGNEGLHEVELPQSLSCQCFKFGHRCQEKNVSHNSICLSSHKKLENNPNQETQQEAAKHNREVGVAHCRGVRTETVVAKTQSKWISNMSKVYQHGHSLCVMRIFIGRLSVRQHLIQRWPMPRKHRNKIDSFKTMYIYMRSKKCCWSWGWARGNLFSNHWFPKAGISSASKESHYQNPKSLAPAKTTSQWQVQSRDWRRAILKDYLSFCVMIKFTQWEPTPLEWCILKQGLFPQDWSQDAWVLTMIQFNVSLIHQSVVTPSFLFEP